VISSATDDFKDETESEIGVDAPRQGEDLV
jgi:hypothetical protein